MRPYEAELVARALAVLEEAIEQSGNIDVPAVKLALWALRPYCDAEVLSRFWLTCRDQNPMWAKGARLAAFNLVRNGVR